MESWATLLRALKKPLVGRCCLIAFCQRHCEHRFTVDKLPPKHSTNFKSVVETNDAWAQEFWTRNPETHIYITFHWKWLNTCCRRLGERSFRLTNQPNWTGPSWQNLPKPLKKKKEGQKSEGGLHVLNCKEIVGRNGAERRDVNLTVDLYSCGLLLWTCGAGDRDKQPPHWDHLTRLGHRGRRWRNLWLILWIWFDLTFESPCFG